TTSDPMVASTTCRPSAAPAMEQRLDHLQPPSSSGDGGVTESEERFIAESAMENITSLRSE
ncbi:MAG: hypothetical protein WBW49_16520, partial [Candidatus Acidiferrum sp.]